MDIGDFRTVQVDNARAHLLSAFKMEGVMRSVRAVQFAIGVLILSVAAWAQEYPRVEIGGDYSYVRFEPVASGTNGLSLNGGGGTFDVNINRYLGIKMDL